MSIFLTPGAGSKVPATDRDIQSIGISGAHARLDNSALPLRKQTHMLLCTDILT